MTRLLRCDLVAGNLIVAMDLDVDARIDLAQALDEVVGERVVVVDQENQGIRSQTTRDLLKVKGAFGALRSADCVPGDEADVVRNEADMAVTKNGLNAGGMPAARRSHARCRRRAGRRARRVSLIGVADAADEHILLIAIGGQERDKTRAA